jgi:hypothetical protein
MERQGCPLDAPRGLRPGVSLADLPAVGLLPGGKPPCHHRHSVQTETFLPSTLGRCLVASVSVISSSSGPIRRSRACVSFAAMLMHANVDAPPLVRSSETGQTVAAGLFRVPYGIPSHDPEVVGMPVRLTGETPVPILPGAPLSNNTRLIALTFPAQKATLIRTY